MKNPIVESLEYSRKIFGSKWKLSIIFYLASGPKRFGELRYHNDGITQRTLSSNLQELQTDGIVSKIIYPEVPVRTEYSLTDIGQELIPVLETMVEWGMKYKETLPFSALEEE